MLAIDAKMEKNFEHTPNMAEEENKFGGTSNETLVPGDQKIIQTNNDKPQFKSKGNDKVIVAFEEDEKSTKEFEMQLNKYF